jgi:hypothetical protein
MLCTESGHISINDVRSVQALLRAHRPHSHVNKANEPPAAQHLTNTCTHTTRRGKQDVCEVYRCPPTQEGKAERRWASERASERVCVCVCVCVWRRTRTSMGGRSDGDSKRLSRPLRRIGDTSKSAFLSVLSVYAVVAMAWSDGGVAGRCVARCIAMRLDGVVEGE